MNNHDARVYAMRVLLLGTDCAKLSKRGTAELTKMLDELVQHLAKNQKLNEDRERHRAKD